MMSRLDPRPEPPDATSSWTRPPARPSRYWLPARLSDMLHGWLDGRHGIPLLPSSQGRPAFPAGAVPSAAAAIVPVAEPAPAVEDDGAAAIQPGKHRTEPEPGEHRAGSEFRGHSAEPEPFSRRQLPWTPRIEVLLQQACELIEGERIRFADDWVVLKRQCAEYKKSASSLHGQVAELRNRLDKARTEPSDDQLSTRRLAERDPEARPDSLVRARRQSTWARDLAGAQQRYHAASARLAEASQALLLHEDLIRERAAVARAAARRQHELALRRVATYLQQLVRTHHRSPELNDWLSCYRTEPDLPDWVRHEPPADESGAEQIIAGGGTTLTGGPDVRDEAIGP